MKKTWSVTEKLHIFPMQAAWTYVPIPLSKVPPVKPGGWGSIPVNITVGKTKHRTSIFRMKKHHFFIPIKRSIREAEEILVGDNLTVKYSVANKT